MKAKKLILQAFGPYADRVEIDFTKLGNNGIYLISGDTGSGKTTIFDAIAYALFDSSSGGKRESKMFRSTFAKDDQDSFVDFSFEYKSSQYRIHRIPQYMRRSKRGEGLTEQKPDASLYLENGQIISGISSVNKAVEELLGVNEDQFKQIVMLAQGDFLRLIQAKNEDRQDLFRKIFSTEKFSILESKIKDLHNGKRANFENIKRDLDIYISNLNIGSDNSYNWQDKELIKKDFSLWLSNTKNHIKEKDNRLKLLQSDLDKKKILLEKIDRYFSLRKSIEEEEINLANYKKEYEHSKKFYDQVELIENKLTKNKEGLSKLKEDLNVLEEISILRKEFLNTEKELELKTKKSALLSKNFEDLDEEAKSLDAFIKKQNQLNDLFLEKNNLYTRKKQDLKQSLEAINLIKNYNENIKKLIKAQSKYTNNKNDLDNLMRKKEEIEVAYYDSQAGILASRLVDGEKCPVCGSKNHPEKAILNKEINKEILDATDNKLEAIREKREYIIGEIRAINGENKISIDSLGRLGLDFTKELNDNLEINIEEFLIRKARLINEIKLLESELYRLKDLLEKVNLSKEKLDEIDKKKEFSRTSLEKLKLEIASLNERLINQTRLIEEKESKVKIKKTSDLKCTINDLELEIIKEEKTIKNSKANFDSARSKFERSKESIKTLEKLLDHNFDQDKIKVMEDIKFFEKNINRTNEDLNKLKSLLGQNQKIFDILLNKMTEANKLWLELSNIGDLYRTITGQISGKDSLKFEVYVQIKYFEDIIQRANLRFMEMTEGRFKLQRKLKADKKNVQAGLDFEIFDTNSGKERDIKTLSGGESFQAALSLALGLSDTVQMYTGGVELSSMFVDEGFGSLDSHSLNQVMKTLFQLGESHKSIGIISHVEKLKESIDKKILVTKGPDGTSSLKVIY